MRKQLKSLLALSGILLISAAILSDYNGCNACSVNHVQAVSIENNNNTLNYTMDKDGTAVITGKGFIAEIDQNIRKNAKKIILSEGITYISNSALAYCEKAEEIVLPSTLSEIKDAAFMHCTKLKKITIPRGVNKIGSKVFEYCENLRKIENLSSVSVDVPQYAEKTVIPYAYYSDGKKVSVVPAGKTATAKLKKVSIRLKANGGKINGKSTFTYTFGKTLKLPTASKKGYVFAGWGDVYSRKGRCNGAGKLSYDGRNIMNGVLTSSKVNLYAYYVRKNISASGRSIQYQLKDVGTSLVIEYSRHKNMSDKTVILLTGRKAYKMAKTYAKTDKDLSGIASNVKVNKKSSGTTRKGKITKLKKGTYYIRFRTVFEQEEGIDNPYMKYTYSKAFGKTKINL